ncbi:hypothetical protein MASR1M12_03030 [Erysipelotrichia bacterium]
MRKNEHEPKHIHVVNSDGFAKIELLTLKVVKNFTKPADLKRAIEITEKHRFEFGRNGMNFSARGKSVRFDDQYLHVEFEDGQLF